MPLPTIFKLPSLLSTSLCLLLVSRSLLALEFELINKGAIPLSRIEMASLETAAKHWQAQFSDPMTIKVNVDWKKPTFFSSDAVLASVQIGRTTAPLQMVKDALLAEAETLEFSILSNLPASLPVTHNSSGMNNVSLTLANAKALGITPANDPRFGAALENYADAHISFNIKHRGQYFYDQNTPQSAYYDFTGIALHELAHALGFTSIVDVQSMNPGVLLNPMLLDVFRFPQVLSFPSLQLDSRETLPAWANFSDTQLFGTAFSSGYAHIDAAHCALLTLRCSASHWDDNSKNLMTSTDSGRVMNIEKEDSYALDRIGIDSKWRSGIPLQNVKTEFYKMGSTLPTYDPLSFATKTLAPDFSSFSPNFSIAPTHAFHISFDGHAGAGYAVFVKEQDNHKIPPVNFRPRDKEMSLERQWEDDTEIEHMKSFPAHFSHFYFLSENSSYRFHFISTFSNYGAIFDPTLGDHGGFRISGFLNADLDGVFEKYHGKRKQDGPQDYDATMTMLLLLQKPHNIKDGIEGIPFSIQWQDKKIREDNILHLIDNTAFGAPTGYNNSSSYQEAWDQRVYQLIGDPEPGRDIAL